MSILKRKKRFYLIFVLILTHTITFYQEDMSTTLSLATNSRQVLHVAVLMMGIISWPMPLVIGNLGPASLCTKPCQNLLTIFYLHHLKPSLVVTRKTVHASLHPSKSWDMGLQLRAVFQLFSCPEQL